ncbi:Hypothetical protein, putative [Bodo saltans]|uniref:Uncharacterized protein n=1 Tax=Bodo saltans TaxID=75058 RepID=A0A0S4J5B3_BODSA|nr:Hypothetical protein, putative [Bodo saltans]|eukprot:CUG81267.1 Hypothetical protein, putative [Bodo saltans]
MRRPSVANKHPTITLTVPGARELDVRSSSAASSQDNATDAASTAYGGPQPSGWETAADYKDTVMFLAQQQSMQNREILEILRGLAASLPALGGHNGNTRSATTPNRTAETLTASPPQVDDSYEPQTFVSSHDHHLQRLVDYGHTVADPTTVKELTLERLGGYTGSQSNWFHSVSGVEIELHAAKSRITQLESINKLLQKQLNQKEETIKRLTDANIAALSSRVVAATPPRPTTHHGADRSGASPSWHMDQSTTPSRSLHSTMPISPSLQSVLMKHIDKSA